MAFNKISLSMVRAVKILFSPVLSFQLCLLLFQC